MAAVKKTAKRKARKSVKPAAPKTVLAHQWTDGGERVLILRRIGADGTSYGGFSAWGKFGENCDVEAPDFNTEAKCGGGLHGWPWGMGLGEGSGYSLIDDRWLVLAARPEDVIGQLEGGEKCKVRCAQKIYDGVFSGAWALVNSGRHRLIEAMSKSGLPGTAEGFKATAASSGDSSTAASSGNSSTAASSGNYSKAASSGDSSTAASSGNSSKAASSGNYSKAASSGNSSTAASSGDSSTAASSGDSSTAASSGNYSTAASSGNYSKAASSGNSSKAEARGKDTCACVAGHCGDVRVGERGAFAIPYWTDADGWRFLCGKVGENGIKADTWYRVTDGKLVESV
jgi:hypothetical protein